MLIESGIGEFSDAQALTAGTTPSENVINLVAARHQMGVNGELWLWLRTNVVANFASTETYLFAFIVDSEATFSTTPKAVIVIADSDGTGIVTGDEESTVLKTAGKTIYCATLPFGADMQYGKWAYILADGGGTASITVDAGLSTVRPPSDRTKDQIYQTNVTTP